MKIPLPNQTVHVSTLTFQTPLLVRDTTDNENKREKWSKERERRKEEDDREVRGE